MKIDCSAQRADELTAAAKRMRIAALDMALASGEQGSHLGGSLSCIEILAVIYGEVLRYDIKNPEWSDRDIFIPSKNHCTLAHFPALAEAGFIKKEELSEYKKDGGRLTGYPRNLEVGLEYSGGSLGMAISVGIGMAYERKRRNSDSRVFVMMGDGELNEGSVWEGFMSAAHYHLNNFTAIIDRNHLSYDGDTEDVMGIEDLGQKMSAFGWNVVKCDGHSTQSLLDAFSNIDNKRPTVIIAQTVKGKGVSFIENKREWHHSRLSKEQYDIAIAEITGGNTIAESTFRHNENIGTSSVQMYENVIVSAPKISPVKIKTWSMLGQRGAFFGMAMPQIAKEADNLMLLTADLSLLSGMDRYIAAYPEKFLNVGIAEQNMIGIAAGLSMEGKNVFATTYASFIAARSLEHVRQHLANMKCNVKIIGSAAGVIAAKSGISHWATEDIAFMRALPNMTVLSAADGFEAVKMAYSAAEYNGPLYIRLSGGLNCPVVYKEDYRFEIGRSVKLLDGTDVAIIATGLMVNESLKAAHILSERNISAAVINMHTIKPLDKDTLSDLFKKYKLIVTCEEHNIIGGLGSAVAEFKAGFENSPRQLFIGLPDSFAAAGSQRYIWSQKGMLDTQIADKITDELNKGRV